MPRQNRVIPFGEVIATPERGTLMGNRGVLHDEHGAIRRNWKGTRWIICLLDFKERKQEVMKPDCYTQLFFLDEATALAAGHRPCAECRRERFIAFRNAWQTAHPSDDEEAKPSASVIDDRLHADRLAPDHTRRPQAWRAGFTVGLVPTAPRSARGVDTLARRRVDNPGWSAARRATMGRPGGRPPEGVMSDRTLTIEGVRVPRFLYGTAWKEETERLTGLALRQGFRGVDTANQRKHYDEAAVGRAVASATQGGPAVRGLRAAASRPISARSNTPFSVADASPASGYGPDIAFEVFLSTR